MKMFVLQNADYKDIFWSDELGWCDLDNADCFFGTELDEEYCLKLLADKKGKWVVTNYKFNVESGTRETVYF